MTAPDTPSPAELLALLSNGLRAADCLNRALIEHMARRFPNDVPSAAVERAMSEWEAARANLPSYDECQRLAAKPADDGVRIPYDAEARLGYVWLIWGLTTDRIDLIAIATTEEACARYLEAGKLMNRYRAVKEEQAFVDHLYGAGMLKAFTNARLPTSTKAKP